MIRRAHSRRAATQRIHSSSEISKSRWSTCPTSRTSRSASRARTAGRRSRCSTASGRSAREVPAADVAHASFARHVRRSTQVAALAALSLWSTRARLSASGSFAPRAVHPYAQTTEVSSGRSQNEHRCIAAANRMRNIDNYDRPSTCTRGLTSEAPALQVSAFVPALLCAPALFSRPATPFTTSSRTASFAAM